MGQEMTEDGFNGAKLSSRPLCVADFRVEGGIMAIGKTPFGERRVGYVTGGEFSGDRLNGEILPGGGNWPINGQLADGAAVGIFDARAVWRTHDGALLYVTYTGRSRVPADVGRAFRENETVDPARYYIRIAPVFETSDTRYDWINGVLAIGVGERMPWGIRHRVFEIL
jgi:hypothetical protein